MSQLESQNHEIVANGTVCTFNNDDISLKIGTDNEIVIVFSFNEDDTKKPTQKTIIEDGSLLLKLYNFNNTLGTGNVKPMKIGTLDSKRIFLSFRVYALSGSETKTIHYTVFQEK